MKKTWLTNAIHLNPLPSGKKIFFASDFHLKSGYTAKNTTREEKIVTWLSSIQQEAHALFLLGDIFDFWMAYKHVTPQGFIRFQHKILEFKDLNIPVYFFAGNHDLWAAAHFQKELGAIVLHQPASFSIDNKVFLVGHGDTLNMTKVYSFCRKIYTNAFFKWIIRNIHPDIVTSLAYALINKNRRNYKKKSFLKERDRIFTHCKGHIVPYWHHDFYIFGHTHMPCCIPIDENSNYCNLGDWIDHYTYGVFDGASLQLVAYK